MAARGIRGWIYRKPGRDGERPRAAEIKLLLVVMVVMLVVAALMMEWRRRTG